MHHAKRLTAVVALVVAIALGCWWMLTSTATDAPGAAQSDFAPTQPRPKMKRRGAPVGTTSADAPKPAESDVYETGSLVVRVKVAATEQPCAGADVYVADRHDKEYAAKTDAAGVARFDALPQGDVRLLVESAGFVRESNFFILVYADRETEFDVALERGVAATGVVLDETGRPLAGASAMATHDRDDWLDDSITPLAEARAAADGTFRLATLPADSPSFLQLTAPGYAVRTIEWNPASGGRVEARLVRAGVLRGVVREPSGRPAKEAGVKATPSDPDDPRISTSTDAQGRFFVDRLPVGSRWTVRAGKADFIDSAPAEAVVVDENAVGSCDLVLRRLPRIEFVVLDPAGAPVKEAAIDLKDVAGRFEPRHCVGGRATFDVAEPGVCRATIDAPGFVPCQEAPEAAIGETRTVVVHLDAGAAIAGVVVDDAGAPVAGAAIDVAGGEFPGFGRWTRSATSGVDGAFRVEGLTSGPHAMNVEAESHVASRVEATAPSSAFRVVLPRLGRLAVRLRAPTGEPPSDAADVRVTAYRRSADGALAAGASAEIQAKPQGRWSGTTWSGAVPFPAGRWRVVVDVRGFLPHVVDVDVAAGDECGPGEILLDRGFSVTGVVVDDVGRPVPDASVDVYLRWGDDGVEGPRGGDVEKDGSFHRDLVPRGVVAVDVVAMVRHGDRAEASNVALPCGPLRLVVRRNGAVLFRVRGATETTPESASVRVADLDDAPVPESGEVRLDLAPGGRELVVVAPGYAPTTLHVDVTPGRDTRLADVVLDKGATLAGRVVDAAGHPVAGAQVEAGDEETTSDEDGRFKLEHLLRTGVAVQVFADGFLNAAVDWTKASPSLFVVEMRRGGVVRGTVRDAPGKSVTDVQIVAVDLSRPDAAQESRPIVGVGVDGAFMARVPAGRWRFVARRSDKQIATRDVEVAEGDETTVDISVGK